MAELLSTEINGTLNVNDYFNIDKNGNLTLNSGNDEIFKVGNDGLNLTGNLTVKNGTAFLSTIDTTDDNGVVNVQKPMSITGALTASGLITANGGLNVNGSTKTTTLTATETITTPTIQDKAQNYYIIDKAGVKFYAPTSISAVNKDKLKTFEMTVDSYNYVNNTCILMSKTKIDSIVAGLYIDIKTGSANLKKIMVNSVTMERRTITSGNISFIQTVYLYIIPYTPSDTPKLTVGSTVTVRLSLSEEINKNVLSVINNIPETEETTFSVKANGNVNAAGDVNISGNIYGKSLYDNSNRVYTPETFHLYEALITINIKKIVSNALPLYVDINDTALPFTEVYLRAKRVLSSKMTLENNGTKGLMFKIGDKTIDNEPVFTDHDLMNSYLYNGDGRKICEIYSINTKAFDTEVNRENYKPDCYGIKCIRYRNIPRAKTTTLSSPSNTGTEQITYTPEIKCIDTIGKLVNSNYYLLPWGISSTYSSNYIFDFTTVKDDGITGTTRLIKVVYLDGENEKKLSTNMMIDISIENRQIC